MTASRARLAGPVATALAVAAALAGAVPASAATIVVTRSDDPSLATTPGCSLRQAVQAANANDPIGGCTAGEPGPAPDAIELPESVRLTRPGLDDTNANGDLDILAGGPVRIIGAGGTPSSITQVAGDRVLHLGGAAVALEDVVITGGVAAGNTPAGDGGGILIVGATASLTLDRVTVSGNRAQQAGGIANGHRGGVAGGTVTITDSTISGNAVAADSGGAMGAGGISNINATLTLTSSTVSGNRTEGGRGGGVYSEAIGPSDATVHIVGSTVAGNAGGGANLHNSDNTSAGHAATMTLRSSVIALPATGTGCGSSGGGGFTSRGFNLADDLSCGLTLPTDRQGVDARLGPLEPGPSGTAVHVPAPDSPAIDRGTPDPALAGVPLLTADQRGLPRPVDIASIPNGPGSDGTDIGAVEVQSVPPPQSGPPPDGGPPPGGGAPPNGASPPADRAVAVRLTIPARPRITARGTLRLRVRCPITETSPPCRGTVTLRTRTRVKLGKTRRQVTLASAGFRAGAGRTATVTLRLRPGRVRLVRTTTVARRATVVVAARDAVGNRTTIRRAVILRPAARAR